jgi:predicted nucleic acid-binding protein
MRSGVAVFDASPLIALHQIGQLELARALFLQTLGPPVVAREVAPSLGLLPDWIEVQGVSTAPSLSRRLDVGELAAIALAIHRSANFVVLDDLAGRLAAVELSLTPVGSLGLLVRAKRHGLIREVRPIMGAMVSNGLYASDQIRRQILYAADETEA